MPYKNCPDSTNFFTKFNVKGDDRPDNVAESFYGDSNLDWVVLLSNNIINVQSEWPLSQADFFTYLSEKYPDEKFVIICADIEDQITDLKSEEKEMYMKNIGLEKTGLNKLINTGYELLDLNTFFTSGPEETRAWTIKKNTVAPKAAAVIHTDFEKKFIRAEAVSYNDFEKYGSFEKAKENGKLRLEGKDYLVKDGDVLFFRVNP